ncbi:FAD-dependent thymidylate synthase [Mycolicibacterium sp. S2-37]|uniref:FAD-dependent thymidylate synthase n=1 Tax=Mycolicibacterium sp. S2-37 TaxID=2810297 RepID=UPI001A94FA6A|nr:FAD-dependent thymidylate synthase [Mycolicibacterium sp. S2-37]MBO0676894.1 FAD-dependent thymidylate synthase [Mycolicibacterium sp. S2-37]
MTTTVVKLIAHTVVDDRELDQIGYDTHQPAEMSADEIAEFAGRNCYRSFSRPNPKTATSEGYLDHIIEIGHESVLEHASATFYIEASRSFLAEITRHRHLSFSVVSQRYVDANTLNFHLPPAIDDLPKEVANAMKAKLLAFYPKVLQLYNEMVEVYDAHGLPRKQAREAARCVLPNMTSSPMVVTANHRAWRYMLKNRWHASADREIRQVAGQLLTELRRVAPNTYQDIPEVPYGL